MAQQQGDYTTAGQHYIQAAQRFLTTQDQHLLQQVVFLYIKLLRQISTELRNELLTLWNQSDLPELPQWEKLQEMVKN